MGRGRSRLSWTALLLGLVAACSPARSEGPDYTRTPVLLVHGHGQTSADWRPLLRHLVAVGYPREYLDAVDIVPNTRGNLDAAMSAVAPAATQLLARARAAAEAHEIRGKLPTRLDIVAHSMGALSSRWFAAKLRPELVRTWIAVAGANHGSNALCGATDPASREMCPAFARDSRKQWLQVDLNGADGAWAVDETPFGLGIDRPGIPRVAPDATRRILYLTVRLEPDRWIQPERSALLEGAGGVPIAVPPGVPARETSPGNFLFQARVGHDPLLKHRHLHNLVAAMLAARDGEAAEPSGAHPLRGRI